MVDQKQCGRTRTRRRAGRSQGRWRCSDRECGDERYGSGSGTGYVDEDELATETCKRMRAVKDVTRKDIVEKFIADVN